MLIFNFCINVLETVQMVWDLIFHFFAIFAVRMDGFTIHSVYMVSSGSSPDYLLNLILNLADIVVIVIIS